MPHYIRADVAGGSYFFTVALAERSGTLLVDRVSELRSAFRRQMRRYPFRIDAMVVLPDHLHCIWTLPPADADFPGRWRRIKSAFSSGLPKTERISASRRMKAERGIWQRRYWEHLNRDERDFNAHVDYIHFNPVKHGYVEKVADWPHSSFHRYVRDGLVAEDWGSGLCVDDIAAGECGSAPFRSAWPV